MLLELFWAGILALQDYIAYHVFTCLIPAFLLAGAMVTFISKEAVVKYFGYTANKIKSFSLATFGSLFLAACSCTVIPIASGLYFGGSGIGPAFILLWVAPAANILALIYTGAVLGSDMALTRIISAFATAFIIGYIMTYVFKKEEKERIGQTDILTRQEIKIINLKEIILILLIVSTLLAPNYLIQKGPYIYKVYVWLGGTFILGLFAYFTQSKENIRKWLSETWWFVKLIFPLMLLGVFIVGVIGKLLPQKVVQVFLGGNSLFASWFATVLGQIMYFATMTEAPFVHTLMKLGMGKGPALALLLTGPGMSLPNMIAIARVFGPKRALVYIFMIMFLGTLVGWFVGNFIL